MINLTAKIIPQKKGFTLVELILIMGLFSVLAMFAGLNLLKPQISINIDSAVNLLSADIKSQQLKAMSGGTEGGVSTKNYGIYFESTRYTLFSGNTYNPTSPDNFIVNMEQSVTLSNNLPSSQIVFSKGTGAVVGYSSGSNIVVTHSSGTSKTININSLGVIDIQ